MSHMHTFGSIRLPQTHSITSYFLSSSTSYHGFFFTQRSGAVPTRRMWDGRGVCFATPPRLCCGGLVCLFVCWLVGSCFLALPDRESIQGAMCYQLSRLRGPFTCIGVWWVSKWRHWNQLRPCCCLLSRILKV